MQDRALILFTDGESVAFPICLFHEGSEVTISPRFFFNAPANAPRNRAAGSAGDRAAGAGPTLERGTQARRRAAMSRR